MVKPAAVAEIYFEDSPESLKGPVIKPAFNIFQDQNFPVFLKCRGWIKVFGLEAF